MFEETGVKAGEKSLQRLFQDAKPWMACTHINNAKLLMFEGR